MISGEVSAYYQAPLVTIDIINAEGRPYSVEATLDTGFTGDLTLPSATIQHLALESTGQRRYEVADGQRIRFDAYSATVSWHEQLVTVTVLRSESYPLLGMNLLWGSRLTLDAIDQGDVTIQELQADRP